MNALTYSLHSTHISSYLIYWHTSIYTRIHIHMNKHACMSACVYLVADRQTDCIETMWRRGVWGATERHRNRDEICLIMKTSRKYIWHDLAPGDSQWHGRPPHDELVLLFASQSAASAAAKLRGAFRAIYWLCFFSASMPILVSSSVSTFWRLHGQVTMHCLISNSQRSKRQRRMAYSCLERLSGSMLLRGKCWYTITGKEMLSCCWWEKVVLIVWKGMLSCCFGGNVLIVGIEMLFCCWGGNPVLLLERTRCHGLWEWNVVLINGKKIVSCC